MSFFIFIIILALLIGSLIGYFSFISEEKSPCLKWHYEKVYHSRLAIGVALGNPGIGVAMSGFENEKVCDD